MDNAFMVGAIKSRLPLLRSAAGLSRAETPRGWLRNALRAANFVAVTFAFWVLIFATVYWFTFIPIVTFTYGTFRIWSAFGALALSTVPIGVYFTIVLVPKLLNFSASGVPTVKTEVKGCALAVAVSSAIAFIIWLGATTSGDLITISAELLPVPVVVLVSILLLVSNSVTSWRIRRGYSSQRVRKLLWVANGMFFAVMFVLGLVAWSLIMEGIENFFSCCV